MGMSARWCRRRKCCLPQEIAIRSDLTTADMVKVGSEIMAGKGLCSTCHTIGKTGALRFPDLEGVAVRAKTRIAGLNDVEYFAQSLYEPDTYIVPGFNPGMPVINKPPIGLTDQEILCVIAYLQTLGGTATVTLQTSHRYYTPPGAAPTPPRLPGRPGGQPAARGALRSALQPASADRGGAADEDPGRPRRARCVRAPPLASSRRVAVGRRVVGRDLRPPALGIHGPDSLVGRLDLHGNRDDRYPGLRVLQRGTPRGRFRARSSGS